MAETPETPPPRDPKRDQLWFAVILGMVIVLFLVVGVVEGIPRGAFEDIASGVATDGERDLLRKLAGVGVIALVGVWRAFKK